MKFFDAALDLFPLLLQHYALHKSVLVEAPCSHSFSSRFHGFSSTIADEQVDVEMAWAKLTFGDGNAYSRCSNCPLSKRTNKTMSIEHLLLYNGVLFAKKRFQISFNKR